MRTRTLGVLGFGLLLAAITPVIAAGDTKEEAIKKDRQMYEGTWQIVSLEVNGEKSKDDDARKITVINEADGKWTIEVEGKVVLRGTSKIDPTRKPKEIDLTPTEGDSKGKTALGIYEVGDKTRKVCIAEFSKERPTEFSSKPGSGHILAVFERVKK
jgi:uncharacterized protein (TIGR03067 family)